MDVAGLHFSNQIDHVLERRGPLRIRRRYLEPTADSPDDHIQKQDRRSRSGTRCGGRSDSGRKRDGMFRRNELFHDPVEYRAFDARRRNSGVHVGTGQGRIHDVRTLAICNRSGKGQSEQTLASGGRGNPVIRVRRGQVLARADRNQSRPAIGMGGYVAALRELRGVLRRRNSGVEKIRSEVDDQVRIGDIEDGCGRNAEDRFTCLDERVLSKGLVGQTTGDARGRNELIHQSVERAADRATEDPGLLGHATQLCGQLVLGVVPAYGLQGAIAAARGRTFDAIRMIGAADSSLTARTKATLVDRMLRVALELDRAALSCLHVQTARRRTFLTGRGVDDRNPRSNLLGLDDVRNQLVRSITATRGHCGTGGEADDFQEVTTIELGHAISLISVDRA